MEWYLKVLRQYADFNGRARRTEFWMFTLISVIITVVLTLVDRFLLRSAIGFSLLSSLYGLAVVIPSFAVGARRLHDTGRSGWWQLISLIPLVGSIILIVFFATEGNRGANNYGPDPKEAATTV